MGRQARPARPELVQFRERGELSTTSLLTPHSSLLTPHDNLRDRAFQSSEQSSENDGHEYICPLDDGY